MKISKIWPTEHNVKVDTFWDGSNDSYLQEIIILCDLLPLSAIWPSDLLLTNEMWPW